MSMLFSKFQRIFVDTHIFLCYIPKHEGSETVDNKTFGSQLKKNRIFAKKTVAEVSEYLTAKGYKASEKTIYSWESGRSQPSPDALLDLCRYYMRVFNDCQSFLKKSFVVSCCMMLYCVICSRVLQVCWCEIAFWNT